MGTRTSDFRYRTDEQQETLDLFEKHKWFRILASALQAPISLTYTLMGGNYKYLTREGRHGLLEGSIISSEIYVPNPRKQEIEIKTSTEDNVLYGYDFKRPSVFGNKAKQFHEGKLCTFLLKEIKDNSKDIETALDTLNFVFDIYHQGHAEFPMPHYAVKHGLLEKLAYEDALGNVGRSEINLQLTGDEKTRQIYQVTPKGNGLIFLD